MALLKNYQSVNRAERAELIIEYALVIGIIVIALMTMQTYMKRGVQGVIKTSADNLAAPAKDYYSSKEGSPLKDLDTQLVGAWEEGIVQYNVQAAPTVTVTKDITLTENPRVGNEPIRVNTITQDETKVSGKWDVTYNLGLDQTFTASEKMKATEGVGSVNAQPAQTAPHVGSIK